MKKFVNSTITTMTHPKSRSLAAALGLFGFLAASSNALAAWYGQSTGDKMLPLASMPTGVSGVTVFAWDFVNPTLWEVWKDGAQWHSYPVYSQPNAEPVAASATFSQSKLGPLYDTYFVAHLDADGRLRLSSWELFNFFGGWTTQVVDSGTQTGGETVAAVMFNDNLYVFYTAFNGITETLKVATYNGKTKTLDGDGGLPGSVVGNMHSPTAVPASDGLHVYYFESGHGLREAFSKDGVNWTFNVIGNTFGYLPSAIEYQNGTYRTINVFYSDLYNNLNVAFAQLGTGNWKSKVVDAIQGQGNNAAVIHPGGGMYVYYVSPQGQVRVAYGTAGNALTLAAIDGKGVGDLDNQTATEVQDQMNPTVTAVEVNGVGPSVFYHDQTKPVMRNSYWK